MTYKIPKDPMKMSLKELFDMQQSIQRESKNSGEHYPMYTKRKPVNGEQPSVDNMHEEATRSQLSQMYKQQNGTKTAQEPAKDERLTQNTLQQGVNAIGAARDGASLYGSAKSQLDRDIYALGYREGALGAEEIDARMIIGDNPEGWRGYAAGRKAWKDKEKKK